MTDEELAAEIISHVVRLERIVSLGDFHTDDATQLATERLLERIGDMVSHFSAEFRAAHPEIEYHGAKRMRNILAHHYLKLEPEKILNAVNQSIPALASQLRAITD